MKKIIELYKKHRLIIRYLLFGFITTVVSLGICYLTLKIGVALGMCDEKGDPTKLLDILGSTTQWISGVLVAFFTNKLWVFEGAEHGVRATAKQLIVFSGSRVGTYFMEMLLNLGLIALFVMLGYRTISLNVFGIGFDITERVWAKLLTSVVIVIANYYISKLLVFKKAK